MSNDLLFELGTEELPSGAVKPLSEALAANLKTAFARLAIQHGLIRCFATPRRLAVLIADVQTMQADQTISKRGPAYATSVDTQGQPSPALLGFAKSCGVSIDALTTCKTDKGEWWVYEAVQKGATTRELLPEIMHTAIAELPIAKPMRWGDGHEEFARPVHWSVLLLGDEVVNCDILGIKTGRISFGHRFHHPKGITISAPSAYESLMRDVSVVADFATRRQEIIAQVEDIATQHNARAVMPDALIDEVTSIVEWPRAMLVQFPTEFLEVPAEALIAAMQSHQKCFALRDPHAKLLPFFITVANIDSRNPAQVILGNENVMRARLSDADFFYRQDRKKTLEQYRSATENVVFQAKLGSLADKAQRMEALMNYLAAQLQLNPTEAQRAAFLSKCDLMTGMVNEFPELQGLMGYYYAAYDGETPDVAQALNEQYMPRYAADELPSTHLGLALSLADRLDIIVGTFAIGLKPSGVKDPFKLRRHALAIVRMLLTISVPMNLSTLIQQTRHIYGDCLPDVYEIDTELQSFILERMQSFYQAKHVPIEVIQAVRARQGDWLYDLDKRITAVLNFVKLPEAIALSAACKRVNNLLQQASFTAENKRVDIDLLAHPAEKNLYERLQSVETSIMPLYSSGEYIQILNQLASLREPIDAFFEDVMVMVDDMRVKQNRLLLLARLQALLQGVADISLLTI
jgi:glycyl-tRNA synthetase beta chain